MTQEHDIAAIFRKAEERARAQGLPYRGAVTPSEAHALHEAGAAQIVDVRTRFEAEYVGRIADTPMIEWRELGAKAPNERFLDDLAALGAKDTHYLFLCRSGVRSHAAAQAAAAAGFPHTYNILEGFEGDLSPEKHRGELGGWRFHGLPWIQG